MLGLRGAIAPTVGLMEDDEMTREAQRLGSEYREQQTYLKEIAGS